MGVTHFDLRTLLTIYVFATPAAITLHGGARSLWCGFCSIHFHPWGLYYILFTGGGRRMPPRGIVCVSSPSSWIVSHWWIVLQPSCILCVACHGLFFVEDMPRNLWLMGGRMMDLILMGNRGSVLPTRTIDAIWAATHVALSTRLRHMPMSSSAVALPICPPRKQNNPVT